MITKAGAAIAALWGDVTHTPSSAPRLLESVAALALRAPADDCRLGDLSEVYVRTWQQVARRLGNAPWAHAASHLAADLRYAVSAFDVALFTRVVDPAIRVGEEGCISMLAIDLRERTMTLIRNGAARLLLPATLLAGSALLIGGAIDTWMTWRRTEALMLQLQKDKAEAIALQIDQFGTTLLQQIGWAGTPKWAEMPSEQRHIDLMRLLRQSPSINELAEIDPGGREQLLVSRLAIDVVASGKDWSKDARFSELSAHHAIRFSSVYLRRTTEPYVSVSLRTAPRGAIVAEINLAPVQRAIAGVKLGDSGYAYLVERTGYLIAHPDFNQVRAQRDLSGLAQVGAALATSSDKASEGQMFDSSLGAGPVRSVYAAIPSTGWRVMVELPAAEVRAPFWGAVMRGAGLLLFGLLAALVAGRFAVRRQPAPSRLATA